MQWLTPHWPQLCNGEKLEVWFPVHPRQLGFRRITFAEPNGQLEDWARSMADGSRLHLWYMPDGRWILHRDVIDPSRGLAHAVVHIATATKVGKAVLLVAAVLGVGSLIARGARA